MGDIIQIADPDTASQYFEELERRLREEWPDIQPLDVRGCTVPLPLIALTSAGSLVGGLAFVAARSPLGEQLAVWINAVLVAPDHRRRGIGTVLVQAARSSADRIGISRLYALTKLPELYSNVGWSIVSNDGENFVMVSERTGACRS